MKTSTAVNFEHERIKEEVRDEFLKAFPDIDRKRLDRVIEDGFARGIDVARDLYFQKGLDPQQASSLLKRLEN
jgi:hypothetical protein